MSCVNKYESNGLIGNVTLSKERNFSTKVPEVFNCKHIFHQFVNNEFCNNAFLKNNCLTPLTFAPLNAISERGELHVILKLSVHPIYFFLLCLENLVGTKHPQVTHFQLRLISPGFQNN